MDNSYQHKKYRTIYISQPTYNFGDLTSLCDKMVFLLTGSEINLGQSLEACKNNLKGFDPEKDAVLMSGKVNNTFLAGVVISGYLHPGDTLNIGIYIRPQDKPSYYKWEQVHV